MISYLENYDLVGEAMEHSVAFPLDLTATDGSGYCVGMIMAERGSPPETVFKHDPFDLDPRRFLFPIDIAVQDAEGKKLGVSIVPDVFARSIKLIKHGY